jgi:hypothetical protein
MVVHTLLHSQWEPNFAVEPGKPTLDGELEWSGRQDQEGGVAGRGGDPRS